ncbi:hypothetical protein [Kitasatospora sp. NRRL B-11411]|uniref:hypothetical protein n=1 Tax=Kitasatospora sp. NRRL B-11411 TaxID=1463822 RepID=UPI0004C3B61A|nr:hypothetical protein [Kitasatospora sp. NRRL B-11411]
MARIRTIKPEYPVSEDLASVSLTAERTFVCLLTQADDEGRQRDNAAVLNGALWSLRPEHTALDTEDELRQLAETGLICRYTGCDGRQYLHVTKWHEHQKISHPTASRLPACPVHEPAGWCGKCKAKGQGCAHPAPENFRSLPEPLATPVETAPAQRPFAADPVPTPAAALLVRNAAGPSESAGQTVAPEPLRRTPENVVPGPWTLDHGPTPEGGGFAAPTGEPSVNAGDLVAEYVASCPKPVPANVRGHLGKVIKDLLDGGTGADDIRAGLRLYSAKPMSPSVLPSMVHEAINAQPAGATRTGHSAARAPYQPFANPADARAYYEGDL